MKFNLFSREEGEGDKLCMLLHLKITCIISALTDGSNENCFYKPALWVLCSFLTWLLRVKVNVARKVKTIREMVPYSARIKCHKDDDIGFEGMDFTEVYHLYGFLSPLNIQGKCVCFWLAIESPKARHHHQLLDTR